MAGNQAWVAGNQQKASCEMTYLRFIESDGRLQGLWIVRENQVELGLGNVRVWRWRGRRSSDGHGPRTAALRQFNLPTTVAPEDWT